jgi:hypothetical protein
MQRRFSALAAAALIALAMGVGNAMADSGKPPEAPKAPQSAPSEPESGGDNSNDYEGESYVGGGSNYSALCNGFGSEKTCDQANSGIVTQSSTATGGSGGSWNTAGWGGQSFGSDASGGRVWANGGDAWSWTWSYLLQSNQIAGRDNTNG